MSISNFCLIGMTVLLTSALRADPPESSGADYVQQSAHLKKHEKILEQIEADRDQDDAHSLRAQQEFLKGTAELSGHDEQKGRDVEHLKSVENQVTSRQVQQSQAHQTYKEAVRQFAPDDPRRAAAKQSWNESRQAMGPLLQSRRTLREDVHRGRRQVHDDRTVLAVQKRAINSDARYRAINDRKIQKVEQTIADDRRAIAHDMQASEMTSSK